MPKNLKRGHLGSFNFFYKPKTSKNARGYPLIKFEIFRKKLHSAEKKPKGGLLEALKNLWFSTRIEPTLSGLVEDEQI